MQVKHASRILLKICSVAIILLVTRPSEAQDQQNPGTYQELLDLFQQREYAQVVGRVEQLPIEDEPTLNHLQSIYLGAESYFEIGNFERSIKYLDYWLSHYASLKSPQLEKLVPYCNLRKAIATAQNGENKQAESLLWALIQAIRQLP